MSQLNLRPGALHRDLAAHRATTQPAPDTIPFDRRLEARSPAADCYASVLCVDAFKTFLGGTMRMCDASPNGAGLLSTHALTPGDVIEVRLAPFKVKGRIGIVRNCSPLPGPVFDDHAVESNVFRYRIGVQYQAANRAA